MFDNVRRVARQLVAYGTETAAPLVINALLFPVFARVVTPADFLALGVLLGWEATIKVIFRWGFDGAFLRLYYEQPDDDARRTLGGTLALLMLAANGVILLALVLASGLVERVFFGGASMQWAFILTALNGYIAGFFFLPVTRYRAREEASKAASLTVARSFLTIALRLVLVVGLRWGVMGFVVADLVVSVILTLALAGTYRRMLRLTYVPALARQALQFGLPHVPFGLLHQAAAFGDRFLLGALLPAGRRSEGGAYQMASTLASVLKLVPVAFQTAWLPFAYDTARQRRDAPLVFARMATYALAVLAGLTLAVAALSGSIVEIALPPAYAAASGLVPWLALGVAVQATAWFPTTSINIAKATGYYPVITTLSAATALGSMALLIPRLGTLGAAFGMIAGQVTQLIATLVIAQRLYPIPYETARLLKIAATATVSWAVVRLVSFDAPLWTLLARTATLVLFPAGLFAVRLFSASERQELRLLATRVATRRRTVAARTSTPPDEATLS